MNGILSTEKTCSVIAQTLAVMFKKYREEKKRLIGNARSPTRVNMNYILNRNKDTCSANYRLDR